MNNDDQSVIMRPRRALNCLQHSPNGKSVVGVSPRKSNRKKVNFDGSNSLKRRTSISLPDICAYANSKDASNLNKSATSTPHKIKISSAVTPIKFAKTNISIIVEEKENPNYCMTSSVEKLEPSIKKKEFNEIGIQCNKSDEDMLFGDSVEGTNYWKLIALKRVNALLESKKENADLHKSIESLDKKNDTLRKNIKDLYELIAEYQEIQKMVDLAKSEENDQDSGYDL